jgi:hypothetical protein
MLPQADVYPAAMRAERLAHVHHPTSPYHLPAIGKTLADPANRAGGAERLADPAVHQRIDVDLARSNDDAERLREVELPRLQTAQHHDANTRYLLPTVPGIGTILRLVGLYEIHASNRFPPVQDVVSSCRLGNGAQASAGKRLGPAGTKIANGPLTGAFSDAAVLVLRDHPPAQQYLARWESNQDHGTALPVLAHKVARAVYDRRKRPGAFDKEQGFHHPWRGAEEPGASLDTEGMNLPDALDTAASRASWQAQARLGRDPLSPAR